MFKKIFNLTVIICFLLTALGPLPQAQAGGVLGLPAPGTMVNLSPAYEPVIIKGLTVHKDNPFLFDFIVDVGQDKMAGEPLKKEGEKLIKYFLASLAIPDKDIWVNLSPYEKNRMIPDALGQTDMGRDLLEQDYILKQITASLIYPEKKLGKAFWDKVYAKSRQMYGTTQVPINTFNKVWIMAEKAEVFEHGQTVFVVGSHLKVMLEEDYLALQKHSIASSHFDASSLGANIVRQIILPELEKEVNTGKNFANLRQIVNSLILANWYKKNLKQALLNQFYSNKEKVNGVMVQGVKQSREQIYEQYLKAYKKGVFNYIKEDLTAQGSTIPVKYFSGGFGVGEKFSAFAMATPEALAGSLSHERFVSFATLASTKVPRRKFITTATALIAGLSTLFAAAPTLTLKAKGDGVSDDTKAFQNAIDTTPKGGVLLIPKGTYIVKNKLKLKSDITIKGERDPVIIMPAHQNGDVESIFYTDPHSADPMDKIDISGIVLRSENSTPGEGYWANSNTSNVIGFDLQHVSNVNLSNIKMYNMFNGIKLSTKQNSGIKIDHVQIISSATPIYLSHSTDVKITNTDLDSTGFDKTDHHLHSVYISEDVNDVTLEHMKFYNTAGAGVHIYKSDGKPARGIHIIGADFKKCHTALVAWYVSNVTLSDFEAKDIDNLLVTNDADGVTVSNGKVDLHAYALNGDNGPSKNIIFKKVIIDARNAKPGTDGNFLFLIKGDNLNSSDVQVIGLPKEIKLGNQPTPGITEPAHAMFSPEQKSFTRGGIDLNTSNGMQWKDSKDGNGVEMNVDPAMIARIQREGINWLSPVILRMSTVSNVWSLAGLQAPVSLNP